MLDKWVNWFVSNLKWNEPNKKGIKLPFAMPSVLVWDDNAQPDKWNGTKSDNKNLTFIIGDYGSSDVGCLSSLSNTLLWYAAAEGVKPGTSDGSSLGIEAYNVAKTLIDAMWCCYRDDIGVSYTETNGSLKRIFEQDVWVPKTYEGTMPKGDTIKNGIKFIDIRTNYRDDPTFQELEAYYKANGDTEDFELNYHRFWHIGDYLMAVGTMATLFPDAVPTKGYAMDKEIAVPDDQEAMLGGDNGDTPGDPGDDPITGDALLGDVDENGVVDLSDLSTLAVAILENKTIEGQGGKNADVNSDGKVNLSDLARMRQFLSHKIEKF
jgi:hypothetical protein